MEKGEKKYKVIQNYFQDLIRNKKINVGDKFPLKMILQVCSM